MFFAKTAFANLKSAAKFYKYWYENFHLRLISLEKYSQSSLLTRQLCAAMSHADNSATKNCSYGYCFTLNEKCTSGLNDALHGHPSFEAENIKKFIVF
jgi:hypothetical protein